MVLKILEKYLDKLRKKKETEEGRNGLIDISKYAKLEETLRFLI